MPSPFPGMDPYLEDPAIWFDFHFSFAVGISASLNKLMPRPYYSRTRRRAVDGGSEEEALAALDAEVLDASRRHELVTFIGIFSPWEKGVEGDERAYVALRTEVLRRGANLVEIDLLSIGERRAVPPRVREAFATSHSAWRYFAGIDRASERDGRSRYEVYPFGLKDRLPVIPLPLRPGEGDVALDLQDVFDRNYDCGPYSRGAVDYSELPSVPLTEEEQTWVRKQVVAAFPQAPEAGS